MVSSERQSLLGKRVRVKFCGLTQVVDVELAVDLGVDAVGCIFYEKSSRAMNITQAQKLRAVLPAWVTAVALFVNPSTQMVDEVIKCFQPGMLQFHGDESDVFCKAFGLPYVKALAVDAEVNLLDICAQYPNADTLLFDTKITGGYGGTGQTFDWSLFPRSVITGARDFRQMRVLAGGLNAENVHQAIQVARPDMVDVSGGIELEGQFGKKDPEKMKRFMQAVNTVC